MLSYESDSDDRQSVQQDVRQWYTNDTDVEENSDENNDELIVEESDSDGVQSGQLDDACHEEDDLGKREIIPIWPYQTSRK